MQRALAAADPDHQLTCMLAQGKYWNDSTPASAAEMSVRCLALANIPPAGLRDAAHG
jgi:hypothetical protein